VVDVDIPFVPGRRRLAHAGHSRNVINGMLLSWTILLVAGGLIAGFCSSACLADAPASQTRGGNSHVVTVLERTGIKSDDKSLLAFLAQRGDSPNSRSLPELVEQLSSETWKTRDEATKNLIAMGLAARKAMEKAAAGKDPEVQMRARFVLEYIKGPSRLSLVLAVIAERKPPGAVPILLARMPDMNSTDLTTAGRALAACACSDDVAILRKAIKAGKANTAFRYAVRSVLCRVIPATDLDLLKSCLADSCPDIRSAGLFAMNKTPTLDDSFVPLLVNMLAGENINSAANSAGFLVQIGDPSIADALLGVLHRSNNYSFRRNVIEGLVRMKGLEVAKPLIKLLAETGAGSRSTVLNALRRLHAVEAAGAIIGILPTTDKHARLQACMVLAGLADRNAVGPLCKIATSDKEPGIQRAAVYALGRIGDVRAVDSLIGLIATNTPRQAPARKTKPPAARSVRMTPEKEAAIYKREVCEQTLTSLATIGGPKAIEALFKTTRHPEPRLRAIAITLLAEMGDKRVGDLVLIGLTGGDYFMASGAVDACQFIDDPRILPALISLASSKRNATIPRTSHFLGGNGTARGHYSEALLRERALRLIKDRWPKEARPVLLDRLKDSEGLLAGRAAKWLADANDQSAVPGLMNLLKNGRNTHMKASAGKALCKLKVQAAFAPCLQLLQESKDRTLLPAMGKLAQETCLDKLEAELKKSHGFRYAATGVAGYVGKPQLAETVVGLLNDSDIAISNAAITALGGLKNPQSVAPLLKRLEAELDALASASTDRPAPTRLDKVRLLASALGNIGDKSAVGPLLTAMNSPNTDLNTVLAIAKALGQIGDARAFKPLVKVVRKYPQAAGSLALLGDKRALPHLQAAAKAPNCDLAIGQAIFKLDPGASVEALGKVLRDCRADYCNQRVQAVELLARAGTRQAIESIRFALTDDGLAVRQAARKALASLKIPLKSPRKVPAGV